MQNPVLSILSFLMVMFGNPAIAEETTVSTCGQVCVIPLPEVVQCGAYVPEGWDDVPAGTIPAFSHVIETDGFYLQDGVLYQELIIATEPEPYETETLAASDMILYNGALMPQEVVEANVSRVFCMNPLTS